MARYTGARPTYSGRVDHTIAVNERGSDTPVQVVEAFTSAMESLFPPLPGSISALRDALGGTRRAAIAITEIPEGANDKQRETLLRNGARRIQRYIVGEEGHGAHGGGQARGTNVANREKLREKLQAVLAPKLRGEREKAILEKGVAMTMLGTLRINGGNDKSYSSGRFIHWHLPGPEWGPILEQWNKKHKRVAARRWVRAFARSYQLPEARWSYLNELTFEPPNDQE